MQGALEFRLSFTAINLRWSGPGESADEALGGVPLAVVFLGAVLFDDGLGHQGKHGALVRRDKSRL